MLPNHLAEAITVSPKIASLLSGLSVRTIYRLLEEEALSARRCGGRTLIETASLRAYLASLPVYVPGAAIPNAPHARSSSRSQSEK
jgi:excisionase family DNA binding protein